MSDDLASRIEKYATHRMPDAERVSVTGLDRIVGGASRETYRFGLHWEEAGVAHDRKLILRRDPPGSLIDTERANEWHAYRAFHASNVPVPEMLWLEEDTAWLEHPFFVMTEIAGFEASPAAIHQPPYSDHSEAYGDAMFEILGRIAAADPADLGLTAHFEAPPVETCWSRELDYWEQVLDEDEISPQPIVRAAIRWCRRNPPPPPARLHVVHGDYRTGNYLYDDSGGLHGVLDWEMVHLGDPLEDLAWALAPVFAFGGVGLAGGLVPRERAFAAWGRESGLRIDPRALQWWEVFAAIKGQGIWVSSIDAYLEGPNSDPILAIAGMALMNKQDEATLQALEKPL